MRRVVSPGSDGRPPASSVLLFFVSQLTATDVLARTTMKGAAKCDKHCDLQNSVNQQEFERILRSRDIPESMPASASTHSHSSGNAASGARLRL